MDNLTKEQRKKNMQNIHATGTKPEILIMRELTKRKIFFSKYTSSIEGKPDILFKRKKIAVFIDSDFWHVNPKRCIMPQSNVAYWTQKLERNRSRDQEVNSKLTESGWKIIRLWEYDIEHEFERSIKTILDLIGR